MGFFFFSLIFHLVLVNNKKLSGFDESSFVSQFLSIIIVISYQHPIFLFIVKSFLKNPVKLFIEGVVGGISLVHIFKMF
jgi:hypothetical protein